MKKHTECIYFLIIAVLIVLYTYLLKLYPNISKLSTFLSTIMALIAAVAFWMQLKRTERLNEANFIMNLNNQFISNDEITRIEHALELYYNQTAGMAEEECSLSLVLERNHEDCQRLINYLVYMESLAAIVKQNVMHLDVIDDLFAYRFFIAVNNPLVQQFELVPYANYYRGCFELSKMWTKKWRHEKREIPLDTHALFECDNTLLNIRNKEGECNHV